MPDFLIDLLKRNKSAASKQPRDVLPDSASEMTLIEQIADHGIRRQHVKSFIRFAIEGNAAVPDAPESNYACEDIVQDACYGESRYRPMLMREGRALGAGGFRTRKVAGNDGTDGPTQEPASIGPGDAEQACRDRAVRLVGDVFVDGEDLVHDLEHVQVAEEANEGLEEHQGQLGPGGRQEEVRRRQEASDEADDGQD
ncbi:hypothetical protein APSETT444_009546 [Aspergillus pseudonomiae]